MPLLLSDLLSQKAGIPASQSAIDPDSEVSVEGLPDSVDTLDEALEYLADSTTTIRIEEW